MKVLIAGGYGFLGQKLAYALIDAGYDVTIGGRREQVNQTPGGPRHLQADFMIPGPWQRDITGFDVVINLVGVNIFQRWNDDKKRAIYDSRIVSTRNIVDGLRGAGKKKILINASATGYYGARGDDEIAENSPPGNDFLSVICRDWEAEAMRGAECGMRVAIIRLGTVFGREGAFPLLVKNFKRFMGSRLGSGKQWFPWIHVDDVAGIILKIIKNSKMSGPYNCVSTGIVTNRYFTEIMSEETHRPVLVPFVPGFMLKLLLGEFGGYLVTGQRVIPSRLLEEGFKFRFTDLRRAIKDLL